MVPESMDSNTKLSEHLCPRQVLGGELSEFRSANELCAKVNSPSLVHNSARNPLSKQCSQNSLSARFLIA